MPRIPRRSMPETGFLGVVSLGRVEVLAGVGQVQSQCVEVRTIPREKTNRTRQILFKRLHHYRKKCLGVMKALPFYKLEAYNV